MRVIRVARSGIFGMYLEASHDMRRTSGESIQKQRLVPSSYAQIYVVEADATVHEGSRIYETSDIGPMGSERNQID